MKEDYKRSLRKQLIKPRGKDYSRLAGGQFTDSESNVTFDDSSTLNWRNSNPRLIEITVFHNSKGIIYGVQGKYKINDKDFIDGPANFMQFRNPDVEKTILKVRDDDYIR